MSHEVETMFYAGREKPWHGLGTQVATALTSADAITQAGLDWTVVQRPVVVDNREVPNFVANVRETDGNVLGIVSDRYQIVQNAEAFSFTDNLIGNDVRYDTAGSLRNGKTIWLLAKMPSTSILGDAIDPYLVFTNSHDGFGAIKVALSPIRVVCNNTLNLALSSASRSWTTKHIGNIEAKLSEARRTLELANDYMSALNNKADELANSPIKLGEVETFISELFPLEEDASDRKKETAKKIKDAIMICYFSPDIKKFMNTKYGVINAISDWCGHAEPSRATADYKANNWNRIMNGHPVLDRALTLLTASK